MTSRERVVAALNHQPTDRVPKDLSGMRSTGISAFGYQNLRNALGLPYRATRVYDQGQMLALPDLDVLDSLGCDVITVEGEGITNAYEQPEYWHPYDFNGRLPGAMVLNPEPFRLDPDGTIWYGTGMKMPPGAHVFDSEHAGNPLILDADLPLPNLDDHRRGQAGRLFRPEQIDRIAAACRKARESTDRAILFAGPLGMGLCIHGWGGVAVYPMICLLYPDLVRELHEITLEAAIKNAELLLPVIADDIDVVLVDADDWGNQNSLMAPPKVFHELFAPYRQAYHDAIHRIAPHIKTFLHSCGALYEILPALAETHLDVLNPVQWSAGGRTPREWKAAVDGRVSFWGGGVNSQVTLPLGSVADVEREVGETVPVLSEGGGYVFCNIHNLLAEVSPEKVIAMYRAAG